MVSIKQEEADRSGINQPVAAHTKERLIDVVGLRNLISTLNPSEAQRKAIETDLKGIRQRLQYLLAVSPAIIYTTRASGDYACTFVSENLQTIMGYAPQEMTPIRSNGPTIFIQRMPPGSSTSALR
jgi:PAS domain-containing protein